MVLLHGNGADEADFFPLEALFENAGTVAALRAPIPSEGGYRWYAHHDVGFPKAESLAAGMAYVRAWIARDHGTAKSIWLAGFSGGAVMASALLLSEPQRFLGAALLHGPLPFDAGVPLDAGRLAGSHVFFGYGEMDAMIPPALIARSRAYLADESGAEAEIRGYRTGHDIPAPEQRDLARWFASLT